MCHRVNGMQKIPVRWEEARCRCSQGHPRSFPRAGLVFSDSDSEPGLSHCSLPAQGNFSDGVGEVCDLSAARAGSPGDSMPAVPSPCHLRLVEDGQRPHSGLPPGHLGSGSRSTGGVLEAGYRNTSTHVVLKTESVSGATV